MSDEILTSMSTFLREKRFLTASTKLQKLTLHRFRTKIDLTQKRLYNMIKKMQKLCLYLN